MNNLSSIIDFNIEPTFGNKFYQYSTIAISSLGCVFNLMCYLVFNSKKFSKKNLYIYLKVYALNSLFINTLQFFTFLSSVLKIPHLTNTYEYIAFKCYAYSPIVTTCYFFSSVLDSYVLMERCSNFFSKLKVIFQPSAKLMCLALLTLCLFINFPYFFVKKPAFTEYNSTFVVYYSVDSGFSLSTIGRVITFGVYFIRDIVTLISVVSLNILLYVSVKTHTNNRNERFNFSKRVCSTHGSINKKRSTSETSYQRNSKEYRLTFIIIIICSISILEHLFQIISTVYSNYVSDEISDYLVKISDVTLAFKHSSNFMIFGVFDKNFDRALTYFFRKFL